MQHDLKHQTSAAFSASTPN